MATQPRQKMDIRAATRVTLDSEREICYWCSRFHVSRVLLMQAVEEVGHDVKAVETYLSSWHL